MKRSLPTIAALGLSLLASGCVESGKPSVAAAGDLCGPAGEAACIAKSEGNAFRSGETLNLRLVGGEGVKFVNNASACGEGVFGKCAVYRLEGYRPAEGLFVLETIRGERRGYGVVDRKAGRLIETASDRPRFSPSGRRFMSVAAKGAAGVEVVVWSVEDGTPRVEWSHEVPASARALYEFDSWQGDDTLVLKLSYPPREGGPSRVVPAKVSKGQDGWTLDKPEGAP